MFSGISFLCPRSFLERHMASHPDFLETRPPSDLEDGCSNSAWKCHESNFRWTRDKYLPVLSLNTQCLSDSMKIVQIKYFLNCLVGNSLLKYNSNSVTLSVRHWVSKFRHCPCICEGRPKIVSPVQIQAADEGLLRCNRILSLNHFPHGFALPQTGPLPYTHICRDHLALGTWRTHWRPWLLDSPHTTETWSTQGLWN